MVEFLVLLASVVFFLVSLLVSDRWREQRRRRHYEDVAWAAWEAQQQRLACDYDRRVNACS